MTEPRLSALSALLQRRGLLASEPAACSRCRGRPGHRAGSSYDSRRVGPGDLFVARRGQHSDGHDHVAGGRRCRRRGRRRSSGPCPASTVPELVVRDAKVALGLAAAWRAGDPSQTLGVVGITGTDGKTTTAYLVRAILEAAGRPAGLLGTTDVIVGWAEPRQRRPHQHARGPGAAGPPRGHA